MSPPRFFTEDETPYCEAGGRIYRVIDAGGQRWFVPIGAWDSPFRMKIMHRLVRVSGLFFEMLDEGVPLDEARQILPAGAMMNLEFEETFGEGEHL